MKCILLAGVFVFSAMACAQAQVQQERFSYPVGLDTYGDNFLALRSLPSGSEGVRWVNVQLKSGKTGWFIARYVGCCRTAGAVPEISASPSASSSCEALWYERNATFKAAGYCFRTSRGIRSFGNEGCQYDDEADVPLSARQREQVAQIRATERRLGCAP